MDKQAMPAPAGGIDYGPGMVQGVKAGGFLFLTAMRGIDPATKEYSDDTAEQARRAFENLRAALAPSGAGLEHVVKVTVYLGSVNYRYAFHDVWQEYFADNPPARIMIEVANPNPGPRGKAHFALDVIALAP
jgi:2-iminobutanoate/2-iminopropanoate deaminase